MAQREVCIGKGQRLVLFRDKGLARGIGKDIKHLLVEHIPGTDLLLNHVEARLFEIHMVHLDLSFLFLRLSEPACGRMSIPVREQSSLLQIPNYF
jgi:hypothetical protein